MKVESIGSILVEGGQDSFVRLTLEEADLAQLDEVIDGGLIGKAHVQVCRDYIDANISFGSGWHLQSSAIIRVPHRDQCIVILYLREDT